MDMELITGCFYVIVAFSAISVCLALLVSHLMIWKHAKRTANATEAIDQKATESLASQREHQKAILAELKLLRKSFTAEDKADK